MMLKARFKTILHAILFFGIVTPIGLVLRVFGWNRLGTGFEAKRNSYWVTKYDLESDAS